MSFYTQVKRFLVGKPIASKHAHHEKLRKLFGLPVFASDALSSTAYATEEILLVALLAGTAGMALVTPVAFALTALMIIVAFSYYQTIQAYPNGGGTYLVSTENLGSGAGRVAGASLLIDYTLTVAVSVSSGASAIISAFPQTQKYTVLIACAAIAIIGFVNLRGTKESGALFAIPTYSYVVLVLVLVGTAIFQGWGQPVVPPPDSPPTTPPTLHPIDWFLILRAFAASCTALTGTEAIADGVPAFRPPAARNAGITLIMMVTLLIIMFVGISYVAVHNGVVPMQTDEPGYKTVLAQIGESIWGRGFWFYLLQGATALILFLAANTAFADFPRLSSFMAKDGFLPRQLMSIGDRLVFQNGILLLSFVAIVLVVVYKGDTHSLIPLYAMGVFISFTLSQVGMSIKFHRDQPKSWKKWVSMFGGLTTFCVTVILLVTKFEEGAWIIVVALAVLLFIFKGIKKHYNYLAGELTVQEGDTTPEVKTTALLLVPRVHKGILHAIAYAKSLSNDVRAIHVTMDPQSAQRIKEDWNTFGGDIPLVILESPYRSFVMPIIEYIDETILEDPQAMVTVIVPQAVPKHWYHTLLHNNVAPILKIALASRKNVVITNVRYFLK